MIVAEGCNLDGPLRPLLPQIQQPTEVVTGTPTVFASSTLCAVEATAVQKNAEAQRTKHAAITCSSRLYRIPTKIVFAWAKTAISIRVDKSYVPDPDRLRGW